MSEPTAVADHQPADSHAHGAAGHGHEEHHGSYLQHVKPYLVVGALLFIFTVITVALSYVDFAHIGPFKWAFNLVGIHGHAINFVIGMVVATFKVCLVGAWFMHLKNEGSNIWRPLIFTFIFCLGLFLLCLLAYLDPIPTTGHWIH
ncbi:MAG: cytochrome C oxidase subunit IV family protein [Bradyrhizobium sp.]